MPNPNLPATRMFGGLTNSRDDKALAKYLRTLQTEASLELAGVQAAEMLAIAKIEALEASGHVGMAAAASLAAQRRMHVEQDPSAFGCVDHVAERAIRGIGHQIELLDRRLS